MSRQRPEIVATGIRIGEGPAWRPDSGDLLVTSVHDGILWLADPATGSKRLFAHTGGGANSSVPTDAGGAVVAQNGGIDMRVMAWPGMEGWPDPTTTPACLQHVDPGGVVTVLAGEGLVQSPNDLVALGDGSIVFTDPPHWPWPEQWTARVLRYRPGTAPAWPGAATLDDDGRLEVLDDDSEYRNGVVLAPDDRILIVAGSGLRWLDPDGGRPWFVEDLGRGNADGMAVDVDGNVFVCCGEVVHVVTAEGTVADELPLPDDAFTLNCCFGGNDLRTLYVTDARHSTVLAYEAMPSPGLPVRTWPAPGAAIDGDPSS